MSARGRARCVALTRARTRARAPAPGKKPLIDLVINTAVDWARLNPVYERARAAVAAARQQLLWTQLHTRRLHAALDAAVRGAVGTRTLTLALRRAAPRARFDGARFAKAWAALHDEQAHGRASAHLSVLELYAARAAAGPDADAVARAKGGLREGLVAYARAAGRVQTQFGRLALACGAMDADSARAGGAGAAALAGSARGAAALRTCARAWSDAEALHSHAAEAASWWERSNALAAARAERDRAAAIGKSECEAIARACALVQSASASAGAAAADTAPGEGEAAAPDGRRLLFAVHGALGRYVRALQVALDELSPAPATSRAK